MGNLPSASRSVREDAPYDEAISAPYRKTGDGSPVPRNNAQTNAIRIIGTAEPSPCPNVPSPLSLATSNVERTAQLRADTICPYEMVRPTTSPVGTPLAGVLYTAQKSDDVGTVPLRKNRPSRATVPTQQSSTAPKKALSYRPEWRRACEEP